VRVWNSTADRPLSTRRRVGKWLSSVRLFTPKRALLWPPAWCVNSNASRPWATAGLAPVVETERQVASAGLLRQNLKAIRAGISAMSHRGPTPPIRARYSVLATYYRPLSSPCQYRSKAPALQHLSTVSVDKAVELWTQTAVVPVGPERPTGIHRAGVQQHQCAPECGRVPRC